MELDDDATRELANLLNHMLPYVGRGASVAETIREVIERSQMLDDYQEKLKVHDCDGIDELVERFTDEEEVDLGLTALRLWRLGLITANDIEGPRARRYLVDLVAECSP